MPINLASEGSRVLMKFLQRFKMNGFIDSVRLQGYRFDDDQVGVCTYGIKLRGYTGGNVNVEVPLPFNAVEGIVREPIVAFLDGRATLISQGMFDRIFGSLNLEKKMMPGWMNFIENPSSWTMVIRNDKNKYRVGSSLIGDPEMGEAFENFNICLSGSEEMITITASRRAVELMDTGMSPEEAVLNLNANFLGSLSKQRLNSIVKDVMGLTRFAQEPPLIPGMVEVPLPTEIPGPAPAEVFPEELPPQELYEVEEPVPIETEEAPLLPIEEPIRQLPYIPVPTARDLADTIKVMHIIRFIYQKMTGETGERTVEPHYVWLTNNGRMILIAWDQARSNWRSFDLNRVKDVNVGYNGDWVDLGNFNGMVEEMRGKFPTPQEADNALMTDQSAFTSKGPAFVEIQYNRPGILSMASKERESKLGKVVQELQKIRPFFGSVLRDKVDYLIHFFKVLGGSNE